MSEYLPGLPEPPPPPEPIAASAVILWRDGPRGREVYWVQRGALRFAGGFYAFPGGRLDEDDATVPVPGLTGRRAALAACAAREAFEETGVLLTTGERPPGEVREAARRALLEGKLPFASFLGAHGLTVDPHQLAPAGRWITPPQFPIRYDAHVFLAHLPSGEEPEVWPGELTSGEWILASEAVDRWSRGDVLLHPPNLWGVQCLARSGPPTALDLLRSPPAVDEFVSRRIEFQRGIFLAAVRTPTLPPATHTNCWIVELEGDGLALVDPGSPYEEEQRRLDCILDDLESEGLTPREIWLTHHHVDHVGGVATLQRDYHLEVRMHPATAARLGWAPGSYLPLADGDLLHGTWRVLHTPGHTRGHVSFQHERTGALLAGDMVSTLSTIVIDPPEGDMQVYLRSLERLRDRGPKTLFPAHGSPMLGAVAKLEEYLAHRNEREAKVIAALTTPGTLDEVTARAYVDVPAFMLPVAARSCLASLEKLQREGRAALDGERWRRR
jgi:glyoxylase-like metal-dependent hydrolase (beta-lactamase superfamily II)/8-oxo-dGTP pyrophosphatase MutT (NUDIX family)